MKGMEARQTTDEHCIQHTAKMVLCVCSIMFCMFRKYHTLTNRKTVYKHRSLHCTLFRRNCCLKLLTVAGEYQLDHTLVAPKETFSLTMQTVGPQQNFKFGSCDNVIRIPTSQLTDEAANSNRTQILSSDYDYTTTIELYAICKLRQISYR